ncbi:hypothetical protein [Rubellicoccus peritrichatus]|uniref:Uncharacterized protein n=1 Tax=Rubellicoccus peritrichatus TaxID=3080537 RepID=A0AAQ3L9K2_9BACT|nr:hypothetical protein [Puniceicoccus sp. CR14]WOO41172.1 hypothetical protein RZN69_21335 [Puniceicoccus sp. CR14]
MKNIERIVTLVLALAVAGLIYGQWGQSQPEEAQNAQAKKKIDQRQVIDIASNNNMILGAGRFKMKKVLLSEGQRETLIRFDTATGDYAILDTTLPAWVHVELPTVKPIGQYENDAHIKLIDDVVFN